MEKVIRVAILDSVPEVYWADDLGITDAQKFIDLMQPFNKAARFDTYFTSMNQFPESIDCFDAILVTGSPCSVHDDLDWIRKLMELIRRVADAGMPVIGSCFGHQLVAKVFGGEVGNNEQGWMIGNYAVQITRNYDWMEPAASVTGLYHFNQERVIRLPETAIAFARTDDCSDFGFTIGENVMCFQGHPEQPKRAMLNFLRAIDGLSEVELARANSYIEQGEPDADTWAQWMMRFYLS